MKITAVVEDVGRVEVELTASTCPSCGVLYAIPTSFRDRIRAAGAAAGYYCPNGHYLNWRTSEVDQLKAKLAAAERDTAWYRDAERAAADRAQAAERSRAATRAQVTKLRKRVAAGACPFGCRRHFADLERHVASKHPGAELEAEGRVEVETVADGLRRFVDPSDPAETGAVGGKVAAARMTPEQLSERGRKGALARWGKR